MASNIRRIHFIDELRGFCILYMIYYHAIFDMACVFDIKPGALLMSIFAPLQPIFACVFVSMSGMSCNLSRSNVKRGIKLLIISGLLTLFTVIFTPGEEIYFGVLHMLACCMLIYALIKSLLEKIPTIPGIIITFLFFLFTYEVKLHFVGIPVILRIPLPEVLYEPKFLFPIGFRSEAFHSGDYFPLLPWLFMFLAGSFFGRYAKNDSFPEWTYKPRSRFLSFVGKHSLIIYLLHQLVLYGIFMLYTNIFR